MPYAMFGPGPLKTMDVHTKQMDSRMCFYTYGRVATHLEYSGISLNMKTQGILSSLREKF